MVLRDGIDLENEESVEDDFDDCERYIWHVVQYFSFNDVYIAWKKM